jgi:hypothetical protein
MYLSLVAESRSPSHPPPEGDFDQVLVPPLLRGARGDRTLTVKTVDITSVSHTDHLNHRLFADQVNSHTVPLG